MTAIHPDVQATINTNSLGSLSWRCVPFPGGSGAVADMNKGFSLLAGPGPGLLVLGTSSRSAWVADVAHALRHLDRYDADDAREAAAVIRAAMTEVQP